MLLRRLVAGGHRWCVSSLAGGLRCVPMSVANAASAASAMSAANAASSRSERGRAVRLWVCGLLLRRRGGFASLRFWFFSGFGISRPHAVGPLYGVKGRRHSVGDRHLRRGASRRRPCWCSRRQLVLLRGAPAWVGVHEVIPAPRAVRPMPGAAAPSASRVFRREPGEIEARDEEGCLTVGSKKNRSLGKHIGAWWQLQKLERM